MRKLFGGDIHFNSVVAHIPFRFNSKCLSKSPTTVTLQGNAVIIGEELVLDGSGDYVKVEGGSDYFKFGGAWTSEAWVYISNYTSQPYLLSAYATSTQRWGLQGYDSSTLKLWTGNGSSYTESSISVNMPINNWYHLVLQRNSQGIFSVYVNGIRYFYNTHTYSTTDSLHRYELGAAGFNATNYLNGKIRDFRHTHGIERYTNNFIPPTSLPLANGVPIIYKYIPIAAQEKIFPSIISKYKNDSAATYFNNVSLQLPFYKDFIDESTSPKNATVYGSPKLINEATYFNGSTDYITYASNPALNLGTKDFTIEFWFNYPGSSIAYPSVVSTGNTLWTTGGCNIVVDGAGGVNKITMSYYDGGQNFVTSTTIQYNTWNHVAYVRRNGVLYAYYNGKYENAWNFTNSLDFTSGGSYPIYIGTSGHTWSQTYTGYIKNLRIIKGIGIYTSNFVPKDKFPDNFISTRHIPVYNKIISRRPPVLVSPIPTVNGDKYFNNNLLVTPLNGTYEDYSIYRTVLDPVPNILDGTTQSSILTDKGLYMSVADRTSPVIIPQSSGVSQLGSANFTIEIEFYINNGASAGNSRAALLSGPEAGSAWFLTLMGNPLGSSGFKFGTGVSTGELTYSSSITQGEWHSLKIYREGTKLYGILDGKIVVTATSSTNYSNSNYMVIGALIANAGQFDDHYIGYIRRIRITKGIARIGSTDKIGSYLPTYGVAGFNR